MAINKRKILQSAQKHMQKGALDKALKDYATLLEADPKDVNIRLKVGDIHLKQGSTDQAVSSYIKVAQRFMKDGFDSKAIALYKQVTKIDPKRYDVYVPLSELYQRLGLSSDALKALQTAADAHYRDGDKDQALDLLRKMATVDPSNTTNRLRVAELLRQEGREEEALAEYDEVVEELDRQGDVEGKLTVLQKILDVDPSRLAVFVTLGSALRQQKKWGQAEATAETMIDAFPGEPEGYELLAGIYQESDRESDLPGVYRRLAEVYKERGDDDHARAIMQRFVSTEALGADENGDPTLEGDDDLAMNAAIGADGTLGPEPDEFTDASFISGENLDLGDPAKRTPDGEVDANEATASSLPPLPPLEMEPSAKEEIPETEGDPEQLFAEASVYLRYGKHERAIESLRAVLSQNPGHQGALEKLGEVLLAEDDTANAVTAFCRAAEAARGEGDEEGFEDLRARIEALDPAAAENLDPAPPTSEAVSEAAQAGSPEVTQHLDDIDIEIDPEAEAVNEAAQAGSPEVTQHLDDIEIEIDPGVEAVSEAAHAGSPEVTQHLDDIDIEIDPGVEAEASGEETLDSDDSIEFEIEDELGFDDTSETDEKVAAESTRGEAAPLGAEDGEPDLDHGEPIFETGEDEDVEEEIDVPDPEEPEVMAPEVSLENTISRGAPLPSQSGGSATTPQQIIEELEEADFYFQQGLLEEAEEVYRRILTAAPNHPQAMVRLGEIEAAQGEAGAAAQELVLQPAVEPRPAVETEVAVAGSEAAEQELAPSAVEQPDSGESDPGMDLPDSSSLDEFDGVEEFDIDTPEEHEDEARPASPGSTAVQAEETLPLVDEAAESVDFDAEEEDGGGDFDLAAELSGAFDGEDTGPLVGGMGGTTEEEGFEQVFAAFKQGVQQELDDGDFEAHYDLGIAYKEMGLLDDAIGEFQIALGGPSRKLASLHAMGLCALDLQRVSDAISHLEQALALPEAPTDQQAALHFDLGRAYQERGDPSRALEAYQAAAAVDPDFGAVGERIAALERIESSENDEIAAEPDEETFESFDDLIAGVDSEPESERYESFDDLMSEEGDDEEDAVGESEAQLAESEPSAAELEAEPNLEPGSAELEAEPAPELEPAPAEIESEPALEPEPAPAELEAEPAPEEIESEPALEPEPAPAELEAEPAPEEIESEPALEPEPAPAEIESEPALEPEPAPAEIESEPALEPEPAPAELEAEPAPEPEVEPERAPQPPAAKKRGRRKKISFV